MTRIPPSAIRQAQRFVRENERLVHELQQDEDHKWEAGWPDEQGHEEADDDAEDD